jgi:hypothetical protein
MRTFWLLFQRGLGRLELPGQPALLRSTAADSSAVYVAGHD